MLNILMGLNLADAVNHPRVHQYMNESIYYDEEMPKVVGLIHITQVLFISNSTELD